MIYNPSDSIKNDFVYYLKNLGISPKSHKNYRSDLSHFIGWLILKVRSFGSYVISLSEALPFLNRDCAREYKAYMAENDTPLKTINRRLSTLRHLSRFLVASQLTDLDFMEGTENVSVSVPVVFSEHPAIEEFRSYLISQKSSPNTIKNYLSDIRQFLVWLETNHSILNAKR